MQFPTVIGGVVPVVNIRGITAGQLCSAARCWWATFTWASNTVERPAIAALNPGVKLPEAAIAPVRRADGSGTSFIFTSYLRR